MLLVSCPSVCSRSSVGRGLVPISVRGHFVHVFSRVCPSLLCQSVLLCLVVVRSIIGQGLVPDSRSSLPVCRVFMSRVVRSVASVVGVFFVPSMRLPIAWRLPLVEVLRCSLLTQRPTTHNPLTLESALSAFVGVF